MPARRGAAQTARREAGYLADDPSEGAAHVREFQAGLFPILVAGDLAAFRRYLARWEEIIGDTTPLEDLPESEQRALMARLLRRPQAYNLPPWPADLADSMDGIDGAAAFPASRGIRTAAAPAPAVDAARPVQPATPPPALPPTPPPVPEPTAAETEDEHGAEPGGTYQIDMLTGELVSVQPVVRTAEAAPAYETAPARPKPRRRRRRAGAALVQLELWASDRGDGGPKSA